MTIILSFLSAVLVVAWSIFFFIYDTGTNVHLLLGAALLPLMLQGMLRKYAPQTT